MLNTLRSSRGMVVAPHHLAAQAGLAVLRDGGNAIEAAVATAAAVAVVYPHMNSIGGDNFWLVAEPGSGPKAIMATGGAGSKATPEAYRAAGLAAVPARGPWAANTVAGAVSGWEAALQIAREWGGRLPLSRLLSDAIVFAGDGFPATKSQSRYTALKRGDLEPVPGYAQQFLPGGAVPEAGAMFRQPRLGETLKRLVQAGLADFYRGEIAAANAADLQRLGSPVTADDLAAHRAIETTPLHVALRSADVYNVPPPTQGIASLIILGVFDRLGCPAADGYAHLHGLVESTKRAFLVRDRIVTDPAYATEDPRTYLTAPELDTMASRIRSDQALPWPAPPGGGDTIWLGAIDGAGRAVSLIQSIYWEFGSGVVLPSTGVLWQNRGMSFSLADGALNVLRPGRKPFHTLNPAMARLADGRLMVYGTMGGEGQPQTQAALFTRHVFYGQELQAAISAPRWLLGRTWGQASTNLKIENRVDPSVVAALRQAGHDVELIEPFSDLMGHAGAIVRDPAGALSGAADPRGDGIPAGY